jgi:hypothetical protein
MKSREESYEIGFRDGQRCGDNIVKTYDVNELLEKLRNPKLDYEDIYHKGFIKTDDEIKQLDLNYEAYKEGFYAGCRDVITVGNEEKELGVGD